MRVNKEFHETLRNAFAKEMILAYDASEEKGISTREQFYRTQRVHIWRLLCEEEGSIITEFKSEEVTRKTRIS